MANPVTFKQESAEAGTVTCCIQFAVGGGGAVGAIQGGGLRQKEFRRATPVVRTGAGVYDVFLREAWIGLLGSTAECFGPASATTGNKGKVTTNNVGTASAPKVTVTFVRDDTGAAADPANGDIASVTLVLKKNRPL